MRERVVCTVLSVYVLLFSACAEPTGQTWTGAKEEGKQEISPMCLPGCTETDPYPSWPGVFLTSAVTPDECTGGNDIDSDGLSDRCENDISQAFAPQLYYYSGDYVGREPYWVAKPVGQKVKIGYLLSYYRDEGSSSYLCDLSPYPSSCHGHNGDSEAIFLIVYYDAAHKHWILDEARYTQHGYHVPYARGANLYPKMLKYPGKLGAYPRSYVAEGKHANYGSLLECNGGGEFGTDTCERVNTGLESNGAGTTISEAAPFIPMHRTASRAEIRTTSTMAQVARSASGPAPTFVDGFQQRSVEPWPAHIARSLPMKVSEC